MPDDASPMVAGQWKWPATLVGGPLDGQLVWVEGHPEVLRLPVPPGPPSLTPSGPVIATYELLEREYRDITGGAAFLRGLPDRPTTRGKYRWKPLTAPTTGRMTAVPDATTPAVPRGDRTPQVIPDITLVEFLRDRLDEDEQTARAAAGWSRGWEVIIPRPTFPAPPAIAARGGDELGEVYAVPDVEHIARHDPARVLREVEAKRRIIDEHDIVHRDIGWSEDDDGEQVTVYDELPVCGLCVPKHSHFASRADVPTGPCMTLRLLALPDAGHPDYRAEEWAP